MVSVSSLVGMALAAQSLSPVAPVQIPDVPSIVGVGKEIVIELKSQTLTAFDDGNVVYKFKCSTGRNNATPPGEWPIRQKLRFNKALPEYGSVPIPFSLRLDIVVNGRRHLIAIHAHRSVPSYPASHGCIRLKYPDAERLFGWADVGIVVSIR